MVVTWKEQVLKEVIDYCNQHGSRSFELQDFLAERLVFLQAFRPENKHVEAKIRQQFQCLRDDEVLSFVDNRGGYTLRSIDLLDEEKNELAKQGLWDLCDHGVSPLTPSKSAILPEKTEYLVESFVRDVGWAKKAKQIFGMNCMVNKCNNRFMKPDKTPYIEVHHIVPLCVGGIDAVWNLSVLCAHHHRMAHFADATSKKEIKDFLLKDTERRLVEIGY